MAGQAGVALVAPPAGLPAHATWFGEDQARYILAVADAAALLRAAEAARVPAAIIGRAVAHDLTLPGGATISAKALHDAHDRFFASWMGT